MELKKKNFEGASLAKYAQLEKDKAIAICKWKAGNRVNGVP